jgi:hypothetical protein
MEELLEKIKSIQDNYPLGSLDLLYDYMDDLIERKEFERIDEFLEIINVTQYTSSILLGFLVTSSWCKTKLKKRDNLLKRIEEQLKILGIYKDGMLDNFK